jgi:hypothetical protein
VDADSICVTCYVGWETRYAQIEKEMLAISIACEHFHMTWQPREDLGRIDPPHPLVCRKRRLNWAVLRMRSKKPVPCHSKCGTIKIPPCSKAPSISLNFAPFTDNGDVSI